MQTDVLQNTTTNKASTPAANMDVMLPSLHPNTFVNAEPGRANQLLAILSAIALHACALALVLPAREHHNIGINGQMPEAINVDVISLEGLLAATPARKDITSLTSPVPVTPSQVTHGGATSERETAQSGGSVQKPEAKSAQAPDDLSAALDVTNAEPENKPDIPRHDGLASHPEQQGSAKSANSAPFHNATEAENDAPPAMASATLSAPPPTLPSVSPSTNQSKKYKLAEVRSAARNGRALAYAKSVVKALSARKPGSVSAHRGTAVLVFAISASGKLASSRIEVSSGSAVLDQAALSALRSTIFPVPPRDLKDHDLNYRIPYIFR